MKKIHNFKYIVLSAVALLVLLIAAGAITYSWIEGGNAYTIQTQNDDDVKTGTLPNKNVYKSLTLDPDVNKKLSLNDIDKLTNSTSKGLVFSETSSADGKNFFFPINSGATLFRNANTNDVGKNFISYNFNVTAAQDCYLAFDGAPSFNVGDDSIDTSAFRIMLECGSDKKVFTTGAERTDQAVTNTSGEKTKAEVKSVNDGVYKDDNTNRMFEFKTNDSKDVAVSIWLEGTDATLDSKLIGKAVNVNMNLKVAKELYKLVVGASCKYYISDVISKNDFNHGTVTVGGTAITTKTTYSDLKNNTTKTLSATPKTHYTFGGWYDNESCTGSAAQTARSFTYTVDHSNKEYYAKFIEDNKYTISVSAGSGGSTTIGTTGNTTVTDYDGTTQTLIATPNAHYTFDGWYDNSSYTGNALSTNPSYQVTLSSTTNGKTYYAKFVEDPKYTINVSAGTGGTAKINSTTATTITDYVNTTVTLNATANTGYLFDGWYDNSSYTGDALSTNPSYQVTLSSTTNGKTYYAKFAKSYTVTLEARTDGVASGSGGNVAINTQTAQATSTLTVKAGDTVSLKATANSGYNYKGIKNSSGTLLTSLTTIDVQVTSDITYYADFITTYTVTIKSVTDGTISGDGGNVAINSGTASASASLVVEKGNTISLSATPNTNYELDGVYTTQTGGTKLSSLTGISVNASITYYARFNATSVTTTIYFEPRSGYSTYNAYVYDYSSGSDGAYLVAWPGTAATYDSYTGCYKYSFTTNGSGQFKVIVSNSGSSQYPASGQSGLIGTYGKTYLFKTGSPSALEEYTPTQRTTITFDASSTSWVTNASAVMQLYDNTTSTTYTMTQSGTTFTVLVPSSVTNITFNRCNPSDLSDVWNPWLAGNRGSSTTYKTSGTDTGSWQ